MIRNNDDEVIDDPAVKNTAKWVFGRLDHLVKCGKIKEGAYRITDSGRKEYTQLLFSGFKPDLGVVASFVLVLSPEHEADAALRLIMDATSDNGKN